MTNYELQTPQRVWINCPSKLDPHHKLHGKIGIAVLEQHSKAIAVCIYFTEGAVYSMLINPIYLAKKLYVHEKRI